MNDFNLEAPYITEAMSCGVGYDCEEPTSTCKTCKTEVLDTEMGNHGGCLECERKVMKFYKISQVYLRSLLTKKQSELLDNILIMEGERV